MPDELSYLAQVDLHIAGAKERIVKQQQLIERLCASSHSVRDAENFLFALTGMLSTVTRCRHETERTLLPRLFLSEVRSYRRRL